MRIAVLGTGVVGTTLGTAFVRSGHEVRLGSRTADNATAAAWARDLGAPAGHGTFHDVAAWGEVVVNATAGLVTLDVLRSAGADALEGKAVLDVSNPLDFSGGFPPAVLQPEGRSVGEHVQEAFPGARVVKTLNTMTAAVMVDPRSLPAAHTVFVAGDDAEAKTLVGGLLADLGWAPDEVVDVGGIVAARGLELYLPLWLSLMSSFGTPAFNIRVVRG
ncbi:MAG: NADP oxidoreductase [Frankiales bacterium]|nr:NADP oxidoreductase [Frankiales bacterium]